jgi:hypothetical protein
VNTIINKSVKNAFGSFARCSVVGPVARPEQPHPALSHGERVKIWNYINISAHPWSGSCEAKMSYLLKPIAFFRYQLNTIAVHAD